MSAIEHALHLLRSKGIEIQYDDLIVSGDVVFSGMFAKGIYERQHMLDNGIEDSLEWTDKGAFDLHQLIGKELMMPVLLRKDAKELVHKKFEPKYDENFPIVGTNQLISKALDVAASRVFDVKPFQIQTDKDGKLIDFRIIVIGLDDVMYVHTTHRVLGYCIPGFTLVHESLDITDDNYFDNATRLLDLRLYTQSNN